MLKLARSASFNVSGRAPERHRKTTTTPIPIFGGGNLTAFQRNTEILFDVGQEL